MSVRAFVALGWSLQAVTWVLALARTGRSAARRNEWPVEILLRAGVVALVLGSLASPGGSVLSMNTLATLAAVALVLGGHGLAILGRLQLGPAWGIGVVPRHGVAVVRRGVYRLVRHPIYWGTGLAILGQALVLQNVPALLLLAGAAFVNPWKIVVENRRLGIRSTGAS